MGVVNFILIYRRVELVGFPIEIENQVRMNNKGPIDSIRGWTAIRQGIGS